MIGLEMVCDETKIVYRWKWKSLHYDVESQFGIWRICSPRKCNLAERSNNLGSIERALVDGLSTSCKSAWPEPWKHNLKAHSH